MAMESTKIIDRPLATEMEESYLSYAMSVIIMRALPDVRDGLKPVHRRILYAMWDIGLKPTAKFRKSATVVGEVLGKYHPHGDSAVYDSLVRLAQDFSMRYRLVHGQGNFGSMDGDAAAAMRYTEAKLSKISEELLLDLEKNTVDFRPNYDGAHEEPTVLPAKLPNLLLNGTLGIAVGMATSIPTHNLREVCAAIIQLIDQPASDIGDLMEYIKGPDFPTGGLIYDVLAIKTAYATGRGGVVMRGRAVIEEGTGGYFSIIITELPYQVNKASLVEKIADLVKDKKIEGIKDLRDESDRSGVRVVIDLKKDAYPKKILNRLYQLTQLQETFHFNMVALVDGVQPRVLTLKMLLEEYIKHREVVVKRRCQFELTKAEDRAHILEGLTIALEKIDAIIKTIKASKNKDEAKVNLMKKFHFTERQTIAILEMKLQQLANLERLAVEEELKEKQTIIKELKRILSNRKYILAIIRQEVIDLQHQYGDDRKTEIVASPVGQFTQEDLIPKEAAIVMLTRDGYIKRVAPDSFRQQHRGGKGIIGLTAKEADSVERMLTTNTHADLLFFTSRGRVFQLKAYEVPAASRTAKGQAVVNFLQLGPEETISALMGGEDLAKKKYLVMVTSNGVIKKTAITAFGNVRRSGLIAITLKNKDNLQWVRPSTGKDHIILVTQHGQAIRFKESDIREMGRTAAGVRGIRLRNKDQVVGMDMIFEAVDKDKQLVVVMRQGFGKRTDLKNYKVQHRGGSGIKTAKITEKTGPIVRTFVISPAALAYDLLIISKQGQVIRLLLKSISALGRDTQGVRLMRFKESNDQVASVDSITTL
ncbi:MAG: DNA gyrase subunit A [Candidatus Kerfeldbacteria bacterium]|nr:DNA gyrase subunit A [Candidatus Kerfeldbacteria bacterium]